MKPIIVIKEPNRLGQLAFDKDELENLLMEAYNLGYTAGIETYKVRVCAEAKKYLQSTK